MSLDADITVGGDVPLGVGVAEAVFDLGPEVQSVVEIDVRNESAVTAVNIAIACPDCPEQFELRNLNSPRIEPGATAKVRVAASRRNILSSGSFHATLVLISRATR